MEILIKPANLVNSQETSVEIIERVIVQHTIFLSGPKSASH